jgi:uncharacterized protein with HEPN domain
MAHNPNALLWDVRSAADAIGRYTAGKSIEEFLSDDMLRSVGRSTRSWYREYRMPKMIAMF